MTLQTLFSRTILFKALMLIIIIAWGASVQISNVDTKSPAASTDIGGIIFMIFSLLYFLNSYLLYRYHILGKFFFIPLVIIFIVLGFLTELLNPSQFSKDLFYLFIFYIVSPIFFIAQGFVITLLYFSNISKEFSLSPE